MRKELARIFDYLGQKIAGKVEKGLSPEQQRIVDYLGEKIVGDVHMVPAHWMLIDLYGLQGEKNDPFIVQHLGKDDKYPAARASFYRSMFLLMDRGIVGRKLERTKTYAGNEGPRSKETREVGEWGYYLRTTQKGS